MVLKVYLYQDFKKQFLYSSNRAQKNGGRFMNLFWRANTILDTKSG